MWRLGVKLDCKKKQENKKDEDTNGAVKDGPLTAELYGIASVIKIKAPAGHRFDWALLKTHFFRTGRKKRFEFQKK
ncbi:hypothetical protein JTE90_008463 [Oedothorax gibbosus]|uniref:Uncharacterized protein n=1 Tax=Oedothorax gibbosus TaxID=931172 RepID=A0AAV6UYT9_9ARAC|nr:hypothetical protein JTE90_008463 [Oedothorax gibbosus]